MNTIEKVELTNPDIYPDEQVLKEVLGRSYNVFLTLLELYDNNEMTQEWRYYKDGKAWLLKVQKKKKTIVWMSAWKGYMKGTIYIPLRLIDEIYNLNLAAETKDRILNTKDVGKSKPCMFDIKNKSVLKDFEKVMHFKIEQK